MPRYRIDSVRMYGRTIWRVLDTLANQAVVARCDHSSDASDVAVALDMLRAEQDTTLKAAEARVRRFNARMHDVTGFPPESCQGCGIAFNNANAPAGGKCDDCNGR